MSFQELLSKDYQKNFLPFATRLSIIIGNLIVFLYFSGWHQKSQFGPTISHLKDGLCAKDAMRSFSTLDMTALMLAVVVCVNQLSFKRPCIDSFNQIITFPASEKNWTILLLVFCIFKFLYQLPSRSTSELGWWVGKWWTWLLKMNKAYRKESIPPEANYREFSLGSMPEEWQCVVCNIILILFAAICMMNSSSFKYQIRNAEKAMVSHLIGYALGMLLFVAAILVIIVVFANDTKFLGSFFLLAFLLDMVRISQNNYMRTKGSSQKLEIGDYIKSLKRISLIMFFVVLYSSYFAYLLEEVLGLSRDQRFFKLSSYFLLYYRNDCESGQVGNVNVDYRDYPC